MKDQLNKTMKSLIFLLENNDSLVSGPGITLLKKTFEHMFERGAPVQDDFTGFNKIHYRSYLTITSDPKYSQSSIPVSMANGILSILARYQNTQITDYKRIKELVEKDIKDSLKIEDSKEIVVYTDAARQYGKIKVYVPGGIDKKITTKIKNLIVEKKKLVKVRDNYGAMQYPVFKYFNTDKNQLNTYYIHQEIIDDVLNLVKSETGLDYRVSGGSLVSSSATDSSSSSTQALKSKDISIIGIEETSHGKKIAIQLNVDYDKSRSIYDSMKAVNLVPRGYGYVAGRPPKFLIAVDSLDLYNSVKQKLIDGKVDVSDLDKFVEDNKLFSADSQKEISFEKKPESIVSAKPIIKFSDPSNGAKNSMTVNIPYARISPDQKAFLKELVQYSFPGYEWDGNNYAYIVSGNFKQYAAFGQILKKFGYHVEDLRTIVTSKLAKGGLERADYEGKVSENFKEKIDERLPECKFEIYDKQKDGIAFLHGRNNAILGDETGFGKCLTMDSLILTDRGLIKLKDLSPPDQELKPDSFYPIDQDVKVWTGKKWARIKSFYYSGIKKSIKLTTRMGYSVTGSLVHPVFVRDIDGKESFVQLKDLTTEFYAPVIRNEKIEFPNQDPELPIPNNKNFKNSKIYKTPNKLNPSLAAFLGYVVSEGWTNSHNVVSIFQDKFLNPETHDHIRNLAKEIFDWDGDKKNSIRDFDIRISSVYIRQYLKTLGIDIGLSCQKSVPWPIFQATKESLASFLRSFFDSEGSVGKGCIEASSSSEQMLKEIQILLLRMGIICSRKPKKIKNRNHIYWRIFISGDNVQKFKENIGFITKRKRLQMDLLADKNRNANVDIIPYSLEEIENIREELFKATFINGSNEVKKNSGLKQFGESFQSTLSNIRNKGRNPTYQFLEKIINISQKLSLKETSAYKNIDNIYQNNFFYDEIASLTESEDELADIEVDDYDHCFVSNGLISHNTITAIAAAELKMQDLGSNSKTLVLTLKAVQKQWVEEIKNVIGANAQISENGTEPKRWTVLYYDNFSSGKNLQKIIDTTKNAGYSVVIFDELHKLKHSTSKRSQNLEEATGDIPYKWGASATISANRAMDVRNQLVMVGHPLGKISESKFKRDFAGMVPGGYRGSYTEGTFEDRIRAAEKLNKWLNLSGVYVRRTKDELREMPNLSVGTSATPIDQDKFERNLREKLRGYKDPELAISELIASREILANLKVDHTVETAIDIVNKNLKKPENNYAASKVVIFTNFTNPGRHIYEKLSSRLKEIDPNFKVLTYLSMTKKSEREKVKEIFTNDPNTKALVMSMKMGGTGISFPNASQNMIINDFDWTPESAEQSEGRIYRINTNHPVNITYTLTDGLDTELFTVVQRKRKLAEMIQKYRKEYQEKEIDESLIQKIVDAQKKMQEIDEEIRALIAGAAAKAMKESYSFKDYLEFFNI